MEPELHIRVGGELKPARIMMIEFACGTAHLPLDQEPRSALKIYENAFIVSLSLYLPPSSIPGITIALIGTTTQQPTTGEKKMCTFALKL